MMSNGMQWNDANRQAGDWLTVFAVVLGLVTVGLCAGGTSTAWAYQAEAGGEPEPAADAAPADEEPGPVKESFLSWMVGAMGLFFGPVLLLLSFGMVALIMMNILQVRRDSLLPPEFIADFEQKLDNKDFQAAYESARNDDSFVARVLAAGLSKLNRGYSEAIEGMQEVGEDENMALEHRLSYLALIGTVSPMIGLMGTVYGMIETFQVIANSSTQPKPSQLADGISTALFTTLGGLAVAIPAMIGYSLLRNRVSRFVLEVGIVSEGLMNRFSAVGKVQPKQGGGTTAMAPAGPSE